MYLKSERFEYVPESWEEEQALNQERARAAISVHNQALEDGFSEEEAVQAAYEIELGLNDACLDERNLPPVRPRPLTPQELRRMSQAQDS